MQPSKLSANSSAGDLLARCLGDEGRAGESSRRSGGVDLIHESLVERDVYPHGPAGIGKQRNGEQHSPSLEGCFDILVAQDIVYAARRRYVSSRAFNSLRMLAKGSCCIGNGLFKGVTRRKASLNVWKPDAESAVGFFFNNRYILCRHRFDALLSRPPASQLVNPANETGRQIFSRVRHGDDRLRPRMLERVVIAVDPIENPSVPLQHCDQLAAVSFHRPLHKRPKPLPPEFRAFGQRVDTAFGRGRSRSRQELCAQIYTHAPRSARVRVLS